jgi:hypothetical protein
MAKKKTEKEVSMTDATGQKVRETSFGSSPKDHSLSKGAKMAAFGYKIRGEGEVWPSKNETVSVDGKTGFPETRDM